MLIHRWRWEQATLHLPKCRSIRSSPTAIASPGNAAPASILAGSQPVPNRVPPEQHPALNEEGIVSRAALHVAPVFRVTGRVDTFRDCVQVGEDLSNYKRIRDAADDSHPPAGRAGLRYQSQGAALSVSFKSRSSRPPTPVGWPPRVGLRRPMTDGGSGRRGRPAPASMQNQITVDS